MNNLFYLLDRYTKYEEIPVGGFNDFLKQLAIWAIGLTLLTIAGAIYNKKKNKK